MERLTGTVQNYAWGSHTLLASLRGRDATTEPEAEIWYGAHIDAPSTCDDGTTLLDRITGEPEATLGAAVSDQFEGRLPFLLKLLAADQPLSLQAHPSTEQAIAGFEREEAAGIKRDAANRSFRDRCHKPELIVAVTPFEALVGFRTVDRSASLLRALDAHALADRVEADGPLATIDWLLNPPSKDEARRTSTVAAITTAALAGLAADHEWYDETTLLADISSNYPGDPGIAVATLLNRVLLQPGEGLFLDACVLHAYISGLGIEVMANSNNVLRGGLTPKHVDTDTLLQVLRPDITSVERVPLDDSGRYETNVDEFSLTRIETEATVSGPAIVLAVERAAAVANAEQLLVLTPTEAAWLAAGESARVTPAGLTVVAQIGTQPEA